MSKQDHMLPSKQHEPVEQEVMISKPDALQLEEMFAGMFSGAMSETFTNLSSQQKMQHVAIFVDYDNVYHGLMENYQHHPDHEDPNKNLFVQLWKRYGQDHVRQFRAYADFEKLKQNLTELQKKRIQVRHVYSNGKQADGRKNSSDIELCIDAIESTYKDQGTISTYVFVTADSDMIPILSRMMYKGKRVELFFLEKCKPKHVVFESYAHFSQSLEEFLSVEIQTYRIEVYVIHALEVIDKWYSKPQPTHWVGQSWLKNVYAKTFDIPGNIASDLLEYLRIQELIFDGKHQLADATEKTSIRLTQKGIDLLTQSTQEAAIASETNSEKEKKS